MKESFREKNFGEDKVEQINQANEIIERYQAQGLRLTLRQLYYQFVSANLVPNTERSYKNLGNLISDGRLAGLIDWDAIEDRVRVPKPPNEFASLESLVEAAFRSFRLPRWNGQQYYAELWVEKDALSGVLEPLAREFHVTMMVNRGYSSQSAMHEAGLRFAAKDNEGFETLLFYLGDHDPSGEDMVRDVQDRLRMFGSEVLVHKLALTMPQIQQHNPPPQPAKMTDMRAAAYTEKYGNSSWEVDALPPEVLNALIRDSFADILDVDKMEAVKQTEEREKTLLRKALVNLRKQEK
jgi:hypothetical protein